MSIQSQLISINNLFIASVLECTPKSEQASILTFRWQASANSNAFPDIYLIIFNLWKSKSEKQ